MIYWEVSVECVDLLTDFCSVAVDWFSQLLAPLIEPTFMDTFLQKDPDLEMGHNSRCVGAKWA